MKIERPIYIQQLINSKDNGLIKIVTGLRRVGKSYLLKTLFKEYLLSEGIKKSHILIIDLEDRRNKKGVLGGRGQCQHPCEEREGRMAADNVGGGLCM